MYFKFGKGEIATALLEGTELNGHRILNPNAGMILGNNNDRLISYLEIKTATAAD